MESGGGVPKIEGFAQSLRAVVREPSDLGITERQLWEFWMSIADGAFTSVIVESLIRDPLIRYIHRMVSCTLIGRRAGAEKCNQLDLFCMYNMISRRPANLACILLSSFARVRRGGATARLDPGPYIGMIAMRLGVYNRFPRRFLTEGPETRCYSLDDMRLAGMCPMDDPARWEPTRPAPEGPPYVEALQRGVPPERQRILHRVERPQQTFPLHVAACFQGTFKIGSVTMVNWIGSVVSDHGWVREVSSGFSGVY
ncbi:hypothetical protein E3N88_18015 [Mikania micrantha]|uniref:Uncharacterized protein n=1 Tax=Mikania micrantha TaxID=192012 RepID=A0A5N6NUU1_9ASTR|nr:hypothetical protein E3N88_18015 [Mikania micrantha]